MSARDLPAPLPDPHSWADFADPEAVAEALGAWDETAGGGA